MSPLSDRNRPGRIGLRIAAALLAFCGPLAGEDSRLDHVEHLTVEDGLAHTTVWDVHQDRRGFLWMATESVLQRYDGYGFRSYANETEDPDSISASQVWSIAEDRHGNLWFGTHYAGLNRFDPDEESFTRFQHDPEDLEDDSGVLWFATRGGISREGPAPSRARPSGR